MDPNHEMQIVTEPIASTACPKCGAMLDVSNRRAFEDIKCAACRFEFEVPARFGNFLLLQALGMGGMGGVYRARDEALNREVAIKVMKKSLGDDPAFIANFQREAQAAAKLNHPNIAQIYSFGQAMGQPYIVMELLSGGSLDRLMADQGPLDPAVVMHIGQQIAEGLREAAEAGLVHGDVKPENILFDTDKNAKLLDFGLAAMNKTASAEIWGTPFYIPPEKVKKQPTDFRSDIYSLGATLYHAIAGVPPFDGTDITAVVKARFISDPQPLRNLRGSVVPEEVDAIILRMMAKEPAKRFPTYGSLLSDMRRYLSKAGPINMTAPSKKIMIKGKRPKATTVEIDTKVVPPSNTTKKEKPRFTFSKKGSGEEAPHTMNKLEEEFAAIAEQNRKAKKMLSLVIGGVFVAIILIVGIIVMAMYRIEENKKKQEAAAIAKMQEVAGATITNALTKARNLISYIKESEPLALKYANEAKEAAIAAIGDEVRDHLVPPEPAYNVPTFGDDVEETPAATTASNTVNAADQKTPKKEEKKASGEWKKIQPLQIAEDGNAEILTKYPVVRTVRSMYAEAYRVKYALLLANAMFADIEKLSFRAEKLKAPEKAKELQELTNIIGEKFRTMGITRELTEVARNVSTIKKTMDSVKADLASLAAVKRQEELEKEKAKKREEEEAKKRKEAEELAAKVKADCEKIAAVEASNVALLKALRFHEASRNLRFTSGEVNTKEGQAALEIAQERVRRIEDVIKHIMNNVQGYKSPKGWLVEAVDSKTLTVSSKKISWSDIFNTRMEVVNELFNAMVFDPNITKNMRVRERTRLEVSAALCMWTFYREIPTAVERAKQIANKASQEFSADMENTKLLMPGLLE